MCVILILFMPGYNVKYCILIISSVLNIHYQYYIVGLDFNFLILPVRVDITHDVEARQCVYSHI